MKKFQPCGILGLSTGDRFYYASDSKKESYCLIQDDKKLFAVKSSLVDLGRSKESLLLTAREVKRNSNVVFLRHAPNIWDIAPDREEVEG